MQSKTLPNIYDKLLQFKALPNIYDKLLPKIGSYCSELLLNVCPIYTKESVTELFLIKLSGLRSATSENVDLKSNNPDISSAAVYGNPLLFHQAKSIEKNIKRI